MNEQMTGYPSIDRPWMKYYSDSDREIQVPECTIFQNIFDKNKDFPSDIAIQYYGRKIRYKQLFDNVEKCAKALLHVGIKKGDIVNLCTAGVPEAIYVMLACSRIGAIANFLNPMFNEEQMIDRINDTETEWIIVLDVMYRYVEKALPKTCTKQVVIISATNSIPFVLSKVMYLKSEARKLLKQRNHEGFRLLSWKEFIEASSSYTGTIDSVYEKDLPVVMVYSSGSTGASKGILLTNNGILSTNYNRNIPADPIKRGDSFLTMIPIWFSTGIVISIVIPLINGVTAILEPQFSGEIFSKDLRKYKPNMTLTATSLWLYVVNNSEMDGVDFSRMNCPITGGEKINESDEIEINVFLKNHKCSKAIQKGYGMCELGGTVTSTSEVNGYKTKANGVGYPIRRIIIAAFDNSDTELTYGQHGEIRVCSPGRMKGYYKNPEATNKYFKRDKRGRVWGCTGDIGYVDEDGEVFILGRATDCYHRENGEVVYLFDIDNAIMQDADVNQCKVVDVEVNGKTELVAHIVLRDQLDDGRIVLERVDNRLKKELPDFMVPHYYRIRETMPVHSNGKRDVGALRKEKEGLISIS